jgi:hypothetical protein
MNYRFLHLNSSGKAMRTEEWSCASDVEAIERASHEPRSFGAELWRGDRRLSVLAGPLSAEREAAPRSDKPGAKDRP